MTLIMVKLRWRNRPLDMKRSRKSKPWVSHGSFRESNVLKSPRMVIRAHMEKVGDEPNSEIFNKLRIYIKEVNK